MSTSEHRDSRETQKDSKFHSQDYSSTHTEGRVFETIVLHQTFAHRLISSFKRDHNASITPKGVVGANGRVFDGVGAARATANSSLHRRLKGRHLQMIAIGGSIG